MFVWVTGAVSYFQVSPPVGSRDETWCEQGIRKRSVSWNLQNCLNCDGAMEVSDQEPHRTTYGQNNSSVVQEIPAEWLPGLSPETVERVRETFVRSPQKSTHRATRELHMPQSIVWSILRKRVRAKGYRLHL
jgi:hypothetical protein